MSRLIRLISLLTASLAAFALRGQNSSGHFVEADVSPGYTLPTSAYFRGDNPLRHRFGPMVMGDLRWGVSSTRDIRMGLGLRGLSFLKPSLIGSPAGIYVFQGADLRHFSPALSLGYEWQFGATAPWQINDRNHPDNTVNGSPVCAMLGVSLSLRYQVSDEWSVSGAVNLAHYSNGNTRFPNSGTNTASLSIGVARRLGPASRAVGIIDRLDSLSAPRLVTDILLWGAWHKKCYHDGNNEAYPYPGVFGCAGINISPMWSLGRRFRVGPSLDLIWDEAAVPESYMIGEEGSNERPILLRPPFMRQVGAGLSAGVEYKMPFFALHVGLGYNALAGCSALRYFYQSLALRTYIGPRTWLNVGYSLRDFSHPRHLMLGLGVRL